MPQAKDVNTEVELLKRDFAQLTAVAEKLDVAIDKLSSVATSLDRMIAVHENRLEYHDQIDKELFTLIEDRRKEAKEQFQSLHSRVSSMRDDFDDQLNTNTQNVVSLLQEHTKSEQAHHDEMAARLDKLEKWRWLVMGAAVAFGFLFSQMEIVEAFLN